MVVLERRSALVLYVAGLYLTCRLVELLVPTVLHRWSCCSKDQNIWENCQETYHRSSKFQFLPVCSFIPAYHEVCLCPLKSVFISIELSILTIQQACQCLFDYPVNWARFLAQYSSVFSNIWHIHMVILQRNTWIKLHHSLFNFWFWRNLMIHFQKVKKSC